MRYLLSFVSFLLCVTCCAQTYYHSDSTVVRYLRDRNITFTNDNSLTLLMNGYEKFDDMFGAIRQAKSSVHLEYFNFRNDSIAMALFDILAAKAAEGVEVRALFDGFGNDSNNKPLKKEHIDTLRKRGIEIYEYDPIRFPWFNHIWSRDHRKIVVIDGNVAYTGGMNVADYYIKGTEQVGEWRDMHCRIEGSAVEVLQSIFLRIWNKETHQNIGGDKYFRTKEPVEMEGLKPDTTETKNHKMLGIINREPRVSNKIIRDFYIAAIDAAKDSIKLVNPYFTLTPSVHRAIKRAIKRGVDFQLMMSIKSDIPLTPDCAFYNAHKLMKKGARVWMYRPGFHHSKIIMVDGKLCTVGSANLNARSLRFDFEENAVIIDKEITRQLNDMFEDDKQESDYLTEAYWDEFRSPWKKFVGWFAHLLAPWL